jgi:hypothetical protein
LACRFASHRGFSRSPAQCASNLFYLIHALHPFAPTHPLAFVPHPWLIATSWTPRRAKRLRNHVINRQPSRSITTIARTKRTVSKSKKSMVRIKAGADCRCLRQGWLTHHSTHLNPRRPFHPRLLS